MQDVHGQPMNYDDSRMLRRELSDEEHRYIRDTSAALPPALKRVYDGLLHHEVMSPGKLMNKLGANYGQVHSSLKELRKRGLVWGVKVDSKHAKGSRIAYHYCKTRARLAVPQRHLRGPNKRTTNKSALLGNEQVGAAHTNGNGNGKAKLTPRGHIPGASHFHERGEALGRRHKRNSYEEVIYRIYMLHVSYLQHAEHFAKIFEALEEFGETSAKIEQTRAYLEKQLSHMGSH